MRSLMIVIAFVLAPHFAAAQTGSGSAGSAAPAPSEGKPAQPEGWMVKPPAPTPEELRKVCADAMNADPTFADKIVTTINEQTAKQHRDAGLAIAKNEKHVLMAYMAMWLVAAGFLMFMWRRQQRLQAEISQLRRDLEAAAK